MVSENRVQRYIDLVKDMPHNKTYVSIDNWGKRAEWIRNGLNMQHFEKNLHRVLEAGCNVGLMITYCFLSIPGFEDFINQIASLKRRYPGQLTIDTPHMVQPEHLTAMIADDYFINSMLGQLDYMKNFIDETMFSIGEYKKFERTVNWIANNRYTGEQLELHRNDFRKFVTEHDKRRGSNFIEAFTELRGFYEGTDT